MSHLFPLFGGMVTALSGGGGGGAKTVKQKIGAANRRAGLTTAGNAPTKGTKAQQRAKRAFRANRAK